MRGALGMVPASLAGAQSGCILPADGIEPPDTRNFAPEVDRSALTPAFPVLTVPLRRETGLECIFEVRADSVIDRNDSQLQFRWVADNGIRNRVRLIRDDESTVPVGSEHSARITLQPGRDFAEPVAGVPPHALSLFITDAPRWAALTDESLELAEIEAAISDAGGRDYSVVEVRWAFDFRNTTGACP